MKKNTILVGIIIICVLIAGAILFWGYQKNQATLDKNQELNIQQVAEDTIEYIKEKFLKESDTISLANSKEENGVYKIIFNINGNEELVYATKNGKFLFTQFIDLKPLPKRDIPKIDIPKVDLFVMAFCPYGQQAEESIKGVSELLKDKININLHYIVSKSNDGKYSSLHGDGELHQDLREICVQKYQKDKFWDFLDKINNETNSENVDEKWEEIAELLEIDVEKIKDCQEKEGNSLLDKEIEFSKIKYSVQDVTNHQSQEEIAISGCPTLVINGMVYDGKRDLEGYKKGICSGFNNAPEECN
ncbi:MAG: hypothetical protein U9P88_00550 [Patescibacteria group bacterium]|nr:hypothetical protein [Patescibacteria group bacterium]